MSNRGTRRFSIWISRPFFGTRLRAPSGRLLPTLMGTNSSKTKGAHSGNAYSPRDVAENGSGEKVTEQQRLASNTRLTALDAAVIKTLEAYLTCVPIESTLFYVFLSFLMHPIIKFSCHTSPIVNRLSPSFDMFESPSNYEF